MCRAPRAAPVLSPTDWRSYWPTTAFPWNARTPTGRSRPPVVTRLSSGRKGRTLQFNGHLDTVHLPYEAPSVIDGVLGGSGAADMKGGLSSAIEAMRPELLPGGGILLTAHDLHEGPWGDGRQAEALIRDG